MPRKGFLKRNVRQIFAIVEKELYLNLRFKAALITTIFNPLVQYIIIFFLFGLIFSTQGDISLGYWNGANYILFIFISFAIQLAKPLTDRYRQLFLTEKYWNTLSAVVIAPVNRFTFLIGILLSQVILYGLGVIFVIVITFFLFPIPFIYLLLFVLVYLCTFLCFGSIGLILGAFAISNENYVQYFNLILRFIFLFSCINYPRQVFPEIIQYVIIINPLYYYFDVVRLVWYLGLEPGVAAIYLTPVHIICFIGTTIIAPIISILLFERIYKKYGITGY
ncbi:MAG: ABC transporter permease [Candidatus Thorarchaeota archaeon]